MVQKLSTTAFVVLMLTAIPLRGAAQPCGDADASGAVTVTDGVDVLRAAADLSSPCTLSRCDANGDSSITVSDGVNVLRAAADLPATLACAAIDPAVAALVSDVFPFVGDSRLLIGTPGVNPCTDGGSATVGVENGVRTPVTLDACILPRVAAGHFRFDGVITTTIAVDALTVRGSIDLDFVATDVDRDRAVHFTGALAIAAISGSRLVLNGSFPMAAPEGRFTLEATNLLFPIGGGFAPALGSLSVTDDNDLSVVDEMTIAPAEDGTAVVVRFDNASVQSYRLDLRDGRLTSAQP